MASDITNSSTFSTTNMQPASGEIIDAVWGKKIAENTGKLKFDSKPNLLSWNSSIFTPSGQTSYSPSGTFVLTKTEAFTNVVGTWTGTQSTSGAKVMRVIIDGTTVVSNASNISTETINWDATFVSDDVDFKVVWSIDEPASFKHAGFCVNLKGTRV